MRALRGLPILIAILSAVSLSACNRSSTSSVDQTKASVPGNTAATPTPPVNDDAKALAAFLERVNQYATLHQKLENSLPKVSKDSTPQQVDAHQRALAKLIQDARQSAKQGDIFTAGYTSGDQETGRQCVQRAGWCRAQSVSHGREPGGPEL